VATTKILTVPNVLSVLRLLGVPLFFYLVLGPEADGWAVILLGISGATDYLDGVIARRYGQESALGRLLDPAVDRLYIIAVIVGLALRDIVPWWLVIGLLARDLVLGVALLVLRRHGYGPPPVHFIGKAATFCLLYAFPLLFLGDGEGALATVARVLGWAVAVWGTGLYWWAGVLYLVQVRRLISPTAAVERDNSSGIASPQGGGESEPGSQPAGTTGR
jgi:cardiolipin synthase (CMP-forming)